MKLSTQSRYGVRAIFDIAYFAKGQEAQVRDISRRQDISPRYLEQIFQKLRRAGIVGSRRGPSGGYFLTREPGEITVGEIVRVTERHLDPVACLGDKGGKSCERSGHCVTQSVWCEAGRLLKEYLDSVTVKDLCDQAVEMERKEQSMMFHI
jgi:Rrf2 family iron-sulfur cluster assembly transcriptional regulator